MGTRFTLAVAIVAGLSLMLLTACNDGRTSKSSTTGSSSSGALGNFPWGSGTTTGGTGGIGVGTGSGPCNGLIVQEGSPMEDYYRGAAHNPGTGVTYVAAHSDSILGGLTTTGGTDAYVQAIDASGQVLWTTQLGTAGEDRATDIAFDAGSGDVVVVGWTTGNLGGTNQGSKDAFCIRLDGQGNQLWASSYGTARDELPASVVISPSGEIAMGGQARNPGQNNEQDPLVVKFSSTGTQQWVWTRSTWYNDPGKHAAIDPATGDVYLIGRSQAFYPGVPQPTPNSNNPANIAVGDILVIKLDSQGNEVWLRQIGAPSPDVANTTVVGSGHDLAGGVKVDENGNLYICGFSQGDADGPGSYLGPVTQAIRQDWNSWGDAVVFKMDPSGTLLWTRQFGTAESDWAYDLEVSAATGRVYVTGFTKGDMTGSAGNAGGIDVFVAALDPSGTVDWIEQYGTSLDDQAYSVTTDDQQEIFIVGYTMGDLDGSGPQVAAGAKDGFMVHLCD